MKTKGKKMQSILQISTHSPFAVCFFLIKKTIKFTFAFSVDLIYYFLLLLRSKVDMVTAEAIENKRKEDAVHFTDFNPVCIAFE